MKPIIPKISIVNHSATNMELIHNELKLLENKRIEELDFYAQKYCSIMESPIDATLETVEDNQILAPNIATCKTFQMAQEEISNSGRLNVANSKALHLHPLLEERNQADKTKEEQTLKSKVGILNKSNLLNERSNPKYSRLIANKELVFQNVEKEKRAAELIIANKELAFQNEEKEKRAAELIIANKELAFQNNLKEKRAAELIVANKELAFQNDEKEKRAAELIRTNIELLKTNRELDRFVYSVSHDLRTPLTSILGLISFIEEESQETDTLEHIGMIRNSVNRLDEFIKNILSYSRNNRTSLDIVQIPLQKTAAEIVDSLQSLKEAERIHFEIDIKEQQPFYSDRLRLNTLLENLVSNAIKFHKTDQTDSFIKIIGHSDHNKLLLSIIDNGIGIAAEHHDKIFDMFYRLPSKNNGSGIGLYIVKDTVQILQGSIEVHSEIGKGTTFNIILKNLKP